jgi:outer membrane receptor protein involved in Fe transport
VPSVIDDTAALTQTDPTRDQHVESHTRTDIFAGYEFRGGGRFKAFDGVMLRVGATNVFDREPPQAATSWTDSNADTATYGTHGRVLYVDARIKF